MKTTPKGKSRLKNALRRGQTAVEYILVTTALLMAFVMIYRVMQWYLTAQFREGGMVIMRKYEALP
jgi:cell division protein FtsL